MKKDYGRHLSFPFGIAPDGRTRQVGSIEEHVLEELIQLLLTNPGERVFLPEFGGGARRLVFENAGIVTEGITKANVTQAIERWLGARLTLVDLGVWVDNERIEIEISYRIKGDEEIRNVTFQRRAEQGS